MRNELSDSTGNLCLAQTPSHTQSSQVIFANHIYAETLNLQAKCNVVPRAARDRMLQRQPNTCNSSSLVSLYRQNERPQLLFQPQSTASPRAMTGRGILLSTSLCEGGVNLHECSVTAWTTGTHIDIARARNALKAKGACGEGSATENAAEGRVFSRVLIFWHLELKPGIFHPHKKIKSHWWIIDLSLDSWKVPENSEHVNLG